MRKTVKDVAVRLWKDERGASLLEYSILIGLITVGVVATVTNVGNWISATVDGSLHRLGAATGLIFQPSALFCRRGTVWGDFHAAS